MRLFVFGLFLTLFIASEASRGQETSTDNSGIASLRQVILEENTSDLRREIKKLLNGSAEDFFKVISSVGDSGEGMFVFMMGSWSVKFSQRKNGLFERLEKLKKRKMRRRRMERQAKREANLEVKNHKIALGKKLEDPKDPFSVMNELQGIILPSLGAKDKHGQDALEAAQVWKNKEVYRVFNEYYVYKGSKLYAIPEISEADRFYSHLWGEIPQIQLEETPLAQGILRGDHEAFRKALEELYSGPAKNLFSLLHSKTEEGDTLFHLVAKVQSHQEEFAREIEGLINFITVDHKRTTAYDRFFEENSQPQEIMERPFDTVSESSKRDSPIDLTTTLLGRAILGKNMYAFQIELEKLLDGSSAREFIEIVNSETETDKDNKYDNIYSLFGNLLLEEMERGGEGTKRKNQVFVDGRNQRQKIS